MLWSLLGSCVAAGLVLPTASAVPVVVERIDGTPLVARSIRVVDAARVELQTPEGTVLLPLDEIMAIVPEAAMTPLGVATGAVFYLADGGRLPGEVVRIVAEGVVASTALGEAVPLRFEHLSGFLLGDATRSEAGLKRFHRRLAERPIGHDLLITAFSGEVKEIRGRLASVDGDHVGFVFGGRTRTVKRGRVFGVVFADTGRVAVAHPHTLLLRDGSRFSGRLVGGDDQQVRIATALGFDVDLTWSGIARIDLHSERVVYLSDRTPSRQSAEGRLHRPQSARMDRSVGGGPLSIAGARFPKGIACRSGTRLTYDLDGAFERFVATLGLDDSVRPAGSVVFRVLGRRAGGEAELVLYESGLVTGRQPPFFIRIDVTGVNELTLVVDFGDELDLADHADWGGARLLRPSHRGE